MIVVADTGPLIGLAKIDRLGLLTVLAAEIFIPPHVHRELLSKSERETVEIERALGTLLHVRELPALRPATVDAIARLDAGERQAVGLAAASAEKALVLMDDQAGRRAAEQLGLATTGLIGLLLRAKEKGRIENVTPLLAQLRTSGYWLSDEIVALAKRMAGES